MIDLFLYHLVPNGLANATGATLAVPVLFSALRMGAITAIHFHGLLWMFDPKGRTVDPVMYQLMCGLGFATMELATTGWTVTIPSRWALVFGDLRVMLALVVVVAFTWVWCTRRLGVVTARPDVPQAEREV